MPGATCQAVGDQFGLHFAAVWRHRKNHLKPVAEPVAEQVEQIKALVVVAEEKAHTLNDKASALMMKMERLLDTALAKNRTADAVRAAREMRQCVELLGRMAGQIEAASVVNVFVGPVWMTVQTRLIAALEPYPEARGAVLHALEGLPA